jgi:putative endonuclease
MPSQRTALGLEAESAVCRHLESRGLRVLDRNWRRPWGELDVVAAAGAVIRFIEVKAASRRVAGFEPTIRADWRKMAKVRRTALTWLAANRYGPETEWQMDVASVIMSPTGPEIELFENV